MSRDTNSYRRVATGLALALVLAVGAGTWGLARARLQQDRLREARDAVILTAELAELVGRADLDPVAVYSVVELFAELHPRVAVIRVLDLGAKRLVASTARADTGDKAAPRRLGFDEKELYDLGQELRAAVETNRREGRAWKPEITVERREGAFDVAAPVERDGDVAGTVLLEIAAEPAAAGPPWLGALLALVLPLALLALLSRRVRPVAERPVVLVAAAGALYVLAVVVFGFWAVGSLEAGARRADDELAARLADEAVRSERLLAGLGAADSDLDPRRWDVDRYRQPREADAAAQTRVLSGRLGRLIAWSGGLALALYLFVAMGSAMRTGRALSHHRRAYAYALPAMVAMLVLVYFPFFYGIVLSFTNANIYNTDQPLTEIWVGLDNFGEILGDFDLVEQTPEGPVIDYTSFYWTLGFTVVWTVANVSIGVSVGLLLALILHRKGFALKPIYRVILILPWAMPNYITSLIWGGMFHSQFGVINQVIQILGGDPVSWFDSPGTAFVTVLSTNGWLSFPFMMVISLGALQSIPADLYEAARVDGASGWQQLRSITLPSLKPALVPAVILSVIWTFNMFNIIYLVSGGQPGGSTEILITDAYKIAFEQYRYGYAAAYSTVIFLILFAYGVWQNRVTRATEGI